MIAGETPLQLGIDFGEVTKANSTALVLMISLLREAKKHNKTITFINVPDTVLRLAKACHVEKILSIE